MAEKSRPIQPERYYKTHRKLTDQILELGARKRYAAEQARFYASLPDTKLQYTSTDAFRFKKMSEHAVSELGRLNIVRDANLWRARRDYEMNTEAYQAQAREEAYEDQFDEIFLKNATRMALEHARPEQCGCTPIKSAISNLIDAAVNADQPVKETLGQFHQVFNGSCQGQKPAETAGGEGCNPEWECGHELGKRAVGTLWREGPTTEPE